MGFKRAIRKTFSAVFGLIPRGGRGDSQQVAVSVVVQLPCQEAWDVLQDFSAAHHYVPGIVRTEIVSQQQNGLGAHRRVYDPSGDYLEETIVEWNQGRGFVIRLHDGQKCMAPFEQAHFSYQLSPSETDKTLIELKMLVAMPWGSFGESMAARYILPVMKTRLAQVAAGMKHFYETGQSATDADRTRLKEAVTIASFRD